MFLFRKYHQNSQDLSLSCMNVFIQASKDNFLVFLKKLQAWKEIPLPSYKMKYKNDMQKNLYENSQVTF